MKPRPIRREEGLGKVRSVHRLAWLWEPLAADPRFILRSMFGIKVVYLDSLIVLGFAAKEEPWRGLLLCTEREHHESLRAEFPVLAPHPILPKWLYLPESSDAFERVGERLVELALRRDPRLGVAPKPKKRKSPPAARRGRR